MSEKREGIIRHEALYPLSHHHHHALAAALKLKNAGTRKSRLSLDDIMEKVRSFWEPGGRDHFREEEEILLPAFAQYADIDRPEIHEMLMEHVKIRALIDRLLKTKENDPTELMRELGSQLQAHVRKEERVIFPMIEKALPEDIIWQLKPYFHENDD